MAHCPANRLLRELVELLNRFAMNVDVAGVPQDFYETSFVDFTRNDLRGESQSSEERGEVARRPGMQAFFIQNMLLNRFYFGMHVARSPLAFRTKPYTRSVSLTHKINGIIGAAVAVVRCVTGVCAQGTRAFDLASGLM